ncbi:MAG: phosphoribosylanthranilate isomerase [Pirellula sp.]
MPTPNESFELRLKYCGFTRLEDVQAAIDVGVSAIGLNFYPKSKRFIARDLAERLSRCAEGQVLRVGVFVNASPMEVESIVLGCGLDCVQLHGDETVEWLQESAQRPGLQGVGILRAMPYRGQVDDAAVLSWSDCAARQGSPVQGILVDAYDPIERGGTGRTARWDLLYPRPSAFEYKESSAQGLDRTRAWVPMLLAGGITADNVEQAMQVARPDGVDVASGIESAPGIKDPVLMRRIAQQVHRFYERAGC